MKSAAKTPEEYIKELPDDRKRAITKLREVIAKNLPDGFGEQMAYGMITYVVPHSIYPGGYHCDKKQALPFISVGSQKNFIVVHHMGLYANPSLLEWFTGEFARASTVKLDMGKGCVRFKKVDDIPYNLLGMLASKISVGQWVSMYESAFRT